jgi:hypothetical protein
MSHNPRHSPSVSAAHTGWKKPKKKELGLQQVAPQWPQGTGHCNWQPLKEVGDFS